MEYVILFWLVIVQQQTLCMNHKLNEGSLDENLGFEEIFIEKLFFAQS